MDIIKEYLEKGFNLHQMEEIKEGFKNGLTIQQVDLYAKDCFDHLQMREIRIALQDNMDIEKIKIFALPEFNYDAMNHTRVKLMDEQIEKEKEVKVVENKKKIKHSLSLINLFMTLVIASGIGFLLKDELLIYFQKINIQLKAEEVTLNYNDPFIAMDYVQEYTVKDGVELILPEDVKTDVLGKQQLLYKIKNKRNVKTVYLTLNVVDQEAPVIEINKHAHRVEVGSLWDIKDYYIVKDNYYTDKDLEVSIIGEYDLNEVGTYDVEIVALDKSNNKATDNIKIEVYEKPKPIIKEVIKEVKVKENNNTANHNQSNTSNGQNNQQANNPSVPAVEKPQQGGSFINGVHDVSVPVDSDLGDLVFQLTNGISASGNLTVDYSSVNLSVPGSYTVNYYSSDGASATSTVNVIG